MKNVLAAIGRGDFSEALVRLWVIAGPVPLIPSKGGTGNSLNSWERTTVEERREIYANRFSSLLSSGRGTEIRIAEVIEEPLALVQALDNFIRFERRRWPISKVTFEVDGMGYWLVKIPSRREDAPLSHQTINRMSWFKHHSVIPTRLVTATVSLEIQVIEPDGATARAIERIQQRNELRAYIAHFDDNVALEQTISRSGRFFATGLRDGHVRDVEI
jgi:hypothetical protein